MALLTRTAVRSYAQSKTVNLSARSAAGLLAENVKVASTTTKVFDIFLSHRFADKEELVGLLNMLEDARFSVLVDWREHPELDRKTVTRETAAALKADMTRCKALLFVITSTSSCSIWMPWELGLFDGMKGRVATVPLAAGSTDFPGQEYAELYPWVDAIQATTAVPPTFWVNQSRNIYVRLDEWIKGGNPIKHE